MRAKLLQNTNIKVKTILISIYHFLALLNSSAALGGTDIMPKHADACRSRYVCIFK